MNKKLGKVLGVVLGIITIVLIAETFFVNLATVTEKVSLLRNSFTSTFFGTINNGNFSSWANHTTGLTGSALNKADSGIDMIYASMATIIIAAVMAAIGIVVIFGKSSKKMKNMSFMAPIVSAILLIVAIILYYEGAVDIINAQVSVLPFSSVITTTISLAIGAYLAIAAVIAEFLAAGFNSISHGKH